MLPETGIMCIPQTSLDKKRNVKWNSQSQKWENYKQYTLSPNDIRSTVTIYQPPNVWFQEKEEDIKKRENKIHQQQKEMAKQIEKLKQEKMKMKKEQQKFKKTKKLFEQFLEFQKKS